MLENEFVSVDLIFDLIWFGELVIKILDFFVFVDLDILEVGFVKDMMWCIGVWDWWVLFRGKGGWGYFMNDGLRWD